MVPFFLDLTEIFRSTSQFSLLSYGTELSGRIKRTMLKIGRLIRSFYQLLLPVLVLLFLAAMGAATWFVYSVSTPPTAPYLVTPAKFAQLSSRGAQITDETWSNPDGTSARGWLLRGAQGAPAVVLLHRYGTDRSHLLNIGVKLSEATNFTVLMPDLRGHGIR